MGLPCIDGLSASTPTWKSCVDLHQFYMKSSHQAWMLGNSIHLGLLYKWMTYVYSHMVRTDDLLVFQPPSGQLL